MKQVETNCTFNPRVSVIVPVYNAEKYIASTLASIIAQDYENFDIHVVDDCSTDASAAVVRRYCLEDSRIQYHRTEKNCGGPAGPRNIGVAAAAGEFIAFCDSDDIWVPHKLSVQMSVAESTGAKLICGQIKDFEDETKIPIFSISNTPIRCKKISHRKLLIKNWIALSSVVVKRSVLQKIGPFNEARSHVAVEDYDMWLRITGAGESALRIDMPLVHYRKLPTSISASKTMMVRKALAIIGNDYARRNKSLLFVFLRPGHWLFYIAASAWMRYFRREL